MPAPDLAVRDGGTDLLKRPLSAGGVGLIGLGATLLIFLTGLALALPPLDAAVVGTMYGLLVVAVLVGITLLSVFAAWFAHHVA